jgi:UDP-N-acetylmuramate: L-alanyl-gamma-D-glutamyl-meso-diaminopimelate ligase
MIDHPFKRIHFIAIGGSVMHQLAISLSRLGVEVSGSDDEIFDPAKSSLEKEGLLPTALGWDENIISKDIDAVVIGMHARADNPELAKASELNIPILSFPEFIYLNSIDKQRLVIAGSHGKTTITSIVMHVLKFWDRKFDFLVGAGIEGFDTSVQLSDAPIIVIEGDEYASSALDKRPKILNYHHHIGVINGIAWDHINLFETEDEYVKQFELFADASPKGGALIFNSEDDMTTVICRKERPDVQRIEYGMHPYEVKNGKFHLIYDEQKVPVDLFGEHNMININAARKLLNRISIRDEQFYEAIQTFKGAKKRLELISSTENSAVYRDYAHSPSKVEGSVKAVKQLHPSRRLLACLELHTFSSLTKEFIGFYNDTFNAADEAVIYFNPHAVAHKRLPEISKEMIMKAVSYSKLKVFDDSTELWGYLKKLDLKDSDLLLMSSGNFDNLDINDLL